MFYIYKIIYFNKNLIEKHTFILCAILLIVSCNNTQSSYENISEIPKNIINTSICFSKKNNIYFQATLTSIPLIIYNKGIVPNISPDNNYIAFLTIENTTDMQSVKIYDIRNKKIISLNINDENLGEISWSPKGRYLSIDSGTWVCGRISYIYKIIDFQKINQFTSCNFIWINDNDILLQQNIESIPRPFDTSGKSLYKLNILNNKMNLIKQATRLTDYYIKGEYNARIYIIARTVDKYDDWNKNLFKDQLFILDNNSLNQIEINNNAFDLTTKRLYHRLNIVGYKNKVRRIIKHRKYKNWYMFTVENTTNNMDVYLLDVDNDSQKPIKIVESVDIDSFNWN